MSDKQKITKRPQKRRGRKGSRDSGQAETERFQRRLQAIAAMPAPSTQPVAGATALAARPTGGTLEQVGREADMAWAGVKRIMSLLNVEN